MLGLALRQGVAVPVLAPGGRAGAAWLACEGPAGAYLVTGDAVAAPPPPEASPLPLPHIAPLAVPPVTPVAALAPALPAASRREEGLLLHLEGWHWPLPPGVLLRVVPMPPLSPPPGHPPGALGLGPVPGEAGAALLLDPAWLDPAAPPAGSAPLMAVLVLEGRCYALPCDHLVPEGGGEATSLLAGRLASRLAGPDAAPLRALAPPHRAAPPPPVAPSRVLLLARVGVLDFALPLEEVAAVVAPQAPAAVPAGGSRRLRGVVAHRGDVLPVLDGGEALGQPAVLAAQPAPPLLRLAGTPPLALAVSGVQGLRRWPEADIHALETSGLVAALAMAPPGAAPERPLPVCRAAALAALLPGGA
ncbi:chemotaxis protein CheW [Teichococcus aestuarii]|uniref:chemotaxis protein CheW n=1 Tax=Teichococcus aestuarii TaxID=568898 RepID=UPI003607E1CE